MPSTINGLPPRTSSNSAARNAPTSPTLAEGASGDDVTFVQRCLQQAGIDVPGGADGEFGPATRKAVKTFQSREGLPASGVVDDATRTALERTVPKAQPATAAPAPAPAQRASDETVTESRRRRQSADEAARASVERGSSSPAPSSTKPRSGLFGMFRSREATAAPAKVDRASSVRTPADQPARAAELESMVRGAGGQWRTGTNELNVVGLRGQDIDGKQHGNAFNRWNDTIAFVWKDSAGQMNVREFRATTDPGVGRSNYGLGVDANGDGIKDVGHMHPGQYSYHNAPHRGMSGAAEPDFAMVARDVDGDGKISASEARDRFRATGLDIHWAWDNPEQYGGKMLTEEVNSSSEGCQVIAMSRGDFLQHVTPLLEMNARRDFRYTLIDRTAR
jgi:peptidoglycan hydrolase-like protein with peptidoglycan-binding domain